MITSQTVLPLPLDRCPYIHFTYMYPYSAYTYILLVFNFTNFELLVKLYQWNFKKKQLFEKKIDPWNICAIQYIYKCKQLRLIQLDAQSLYLTFAALSLFPLWQVGWRCSSDGWSWRVPVPPPDPPPEPPPGSSASWPVGNLLSSPQALAATTDNIHLTSLCKHIHIHLYMYVRAGYTVAINTFRNL